jgi:peptide methionine sulfoxide reductase MsrB
MKYFDLKYPCELLSCLYECKACAFFLFGLRDYWHCGHSWPIVPASGDMKMIAEKQMECRLAREIEVLRENLPQRHFCPSQNPT